MKMQICIVRYGKNRSLVKGLDLLRRQFPKAEITVINNAPLEADLQEIQGSNLAFEFSGYLELLENRPKQGVVILLNDTLFKHHFAGGWVRFIRSFLEVLSTEDKVIYGDIRWDGTALVERPNPFLASWLFVIPNEISNEVFRSTLRDVIQMPIPKMSAEYELFLTEWLVSSGLWKGWQGSEKDTVTIERKKKCIYWEHQLSANLAKSGVELRSIGEKNRVGYWVLRWVDRLKIGFWRITCRFARL